MNRVDVAILSHFAGRRETSFAPTSTASAVSNVKAESIPARTRMGWVCAANVRVRIWVLSPSSMSAISVKLAIMGMLLRFGLMKTSLVLVFLRKGSTPNATKTVPDAVCT